MSVFSGPTLAKKVYPLLPTGEYVACLLDVTYETGGTYGDSLLWKWLLALPTSPTDYIARDDGDEKVFHEYSPTDIVLGSKSHEWIAALTGRVLAEGDEPPEDTELVGQRMTVYVSHQAPKQGPNKGVLRERFVQGSAKRYTLVPPRKVAAPAPARPEATEDERARALLIEETGRQIGKAAKLETPSWQTWARLDVDNLADEALQMIVRDAKAEVLAALDA